MKSTAKVLLFAAVLFSGVAFYSCNKDREADWLCKCPEGIPSTNPNVGTMGAQDFRYNAVTKDIAEGRCNEESAGRVSECVLNEVK